MLTSHALPQRHPSASATLRRNRRASGFTLLEILVVIAILGLLVGLVITNVGGSYTNSQKDVAKLFVNTSVGTPLTTYRIDNGSYPSTSDGLAALISAPADAKNWRGPYTADGKPLADDPWGHPYQYLYPGTHNPSSYDVWSMGPDGQTGTGDDIGNWTASGGEGEGDGEAQK